MKGCLRTRGMMLGPFKDDIGCPVPIMDLEVWHRIVTSGLGLPGPPRLCWLFVSWAAVERGVTSVREPVDERTLVIGQRRFPCEPCL